MSDFKAGFGKNAQLSDTIQSLSKRNLKLERMIAKLGTPADNQDFRESLHREESDALSLIKQCISLVRSTVKGHDAQMMSSLMQQFQAEKERFEAIERRIEGKERQIVKAGSSSKGGHTALSDSAHVDSDSVTIDVGVRQQQLIDDQLEPQLIEYTEQEIQKRTQHIREIERSITEVASMYQDLQQLVHEQQDSIDIIDNNIQSAKVKAESGHGELVQAEDYQRRARKRKCCIVVILLIVAGVIAIITWTMIK